MPFVTVDSNTFFVVCSLMGHCKERIERGIALATPVPTMCRRALFVATSKRPWRSELQQPRRNPMQHRLLYKTLILRRPWKRFGRLMVCTVAKCRLIREMVC